MALRSMRSWTCSETVWNSKEYAWPSLPRVGLILETCADGRTWMGELGRHAAQAAVCPSWLRSDGRRLESTTRISFYIISTILATRMSQDR
jgi:hypothetical protein